MPSEDHIVSDGECISSISFSRGFFWETIWNHGNNAELKSKRKDPNILKAGDVVHIPELTIKEESCATEQTHKFKLKGVPAKLKLKLMRAKPPKPEEEEPASPGGGEDDESQMADPEYKPPVDEEEPIAKAPYVFEVDGVVVKEGKTDGDGCVEIPLVPDAKEGRITVYKGQPEEKVITLDLGAMDPIDEPQGVRKRLINLGYLCRSEGPEDSDDLQAALCKFQQTNSLDVTGKADGATKDKLKELHGS
jgi:hypothetical protein